MFIMTSFRHGGTNKATTLRCRRGSSRAAANTITWSKQSVVRLHQGGILKNLNQQWRLNQWPLWVASILSSVSKMKRRVVSNFVVVFFFFEAEKSTKGNKGWDQAQDAVQPEPVFKFISEFLILMFRRGRFCAAIISLRFNYHHPGLIPTRAHTKSEEEPGLSGNGVWG